MNRFRTANRARAAGFTLIELMVCVAIVGILAAIAYPAYGKYLIKSNRSAAQSQMMALAQAEAQYMADSRTYAQLGELGTSMATPAAIAAKYTIKIDTFDAPPRFTITATPVGDQVSDGVLTLNEAGTRTPPEKW